MIPMLADLRIHSPRRRFALMGIPLFLLWILLLPVALLLLPVLFIVCLAVRISFFQLLAGLWRLLSSLRDTHVEIKDGQHSVLVHIT
jgi:hypothetical protein